MESLKAIAERQQKDGPRYYDDPEKERMLKLLLELAEEICVLRDRLATMEQITHSGGSPTEEVIERFVLDEEEIEKRLALHQAFYEETFRKLSG